MTHLVRLLLIGSLLAGCGVVWADTTWVAPGPVSGLWEAAGSPYVIQGHVQIPPQEQLHIGAGVTVYFDGHCRLLVEGALLTEGTESEPVLMTTDTVANPQGWAGIWMIAPTDSSHLVYTILEHGRAEGSADWALGGALLLDRARLWMDGCTIRSCRAITGHGIYARNYTELSLTDCWLYGNGGITGRGGAINCQGQTSLSLERCVVSYNAALYGGGLNLENTVARIVDSEIAKNNAEVWGGGLYCGETMLLMTGTTLATNLSMGGGGLDGHYALNLVMDSCLVIGNSAMRLGSQGLGGGMNLQNGEHELTRVTFAGNQAPAAAALNCGPHTHVRNCIFSYGTNGSSVQFNYAGSSIRYSCFGQNPSGDFAGPHAPLGLGQSLRVNTNGDSCDNAFNLFTDPLFDDTTGRPFDLAPTSPCIDAGDPLLPREADGSLSDIGWRPALYVTAAVPRGGEPPQSPALSAAYPNPFNPRTTLRWDLARAGLVSLRIYDLTGREVVTLFEGRQSAGPHTLEWDAAALPSGTYVALLCAGDVRAAQKLMLLK